MADEKKRILFVDDEPRVLEALRDLLRRYRNKWDMVFVTSGEQALVETERSHFDVVVSDMRMPKMDGAELLHRLQKTKPHIVRIVLSGYSELEAAMRAVPVAHQFLAKPIEPRKLESVIERACNLQALLQNEEIRSLASKLNNLPSVPKLYADLNRILASEKASTEQVARLVEQDPAMCAKILQLVNSSFFGFPQKIKSVRSAIAYIGTNMLKNLALSAGIFRPGEAHAPSAAFLEALQAHSMFVAALSTKLLQEKDDLKVEDAFIAGILHDLGKLVLAVELREEYALLLKDDQDAKFSISEAERQVFRVSHAEIGAYVIGIWGLPYPIVEAVAYHHSPSLIAPEGRGLLDAVFIADCLFYETSGQNPAKAEFYSNQLDAYLEAMNGKGFYPTWKGLADQIATAITP